MLRDRWIGAVTDTVMGAVWMTFVLVMILACMKQDFYYFDFYGN